MTTTAPEPRVLSAPLRVSFDYTRSLGPVLSEFMTGLRDGRLVGSRLSDGRVAVPPLEFDPLTHEACTDLVPVADTGVVGPWTWVTEPVAGQPFDRPFAFALVTLDGTDVPMLHAVDVASPDQLHTGLRVRARWAPDRVGAITDLACFEPLPAPETGRPDTAHQNAGGAGGGVRGEPQAPGTQSRGSGEDVPPGAATADTPAGVPLGDQVTGIVTPTDLRYTYEASPEESAFFRGLAEGRLLGQRCPTCHKVYVPPRGACPVDGVPTTDEVELPDTGIVTTFCIVNVPFLGQKITPPYVSAYVLLDGADIAFLHLIQGIPADEVRMGMRVRAVWKPRDQWVTSIENIEHFEPTGEPDASYESFATHL